MWEKYEAQREMSDILMFVLFFLLRQQSVGGQKKVVWREIDSTSGKHIYLFGFISVFFFL